MPRVIGFSLAIVFFVLATCASAQEDAGVWTHDRGQYSNRKLGKAKMKCAKKFSGDAWGYCMAKKGFRLVPYCVPQPG